MENVKPTTVYGIYIKEMSKSKIMRKIQYLVTAQGGKLTIEFKSSFLIKVTRSG